MFAPFEGRVVELGFSFGSGRAPIHRGLRAGHELLRGVTSTTVALNRKTTSPSIHRTSSLDVRKVMRAGIRPLGSALVAMLVRVLWWIRSGSCAGARLGAMCEVMGTKSRSVPLQEPARPHAAIGMFWNDLAPRCNTPEGAA
ncbi:MULTISPECIES: hypothetical protein [unclassified Variovorax]|uniref:hypothetical protein n=1 Tax=unclassified Variovorax TaxID=663243 RepID=UPI003F48C5F5